MAHGRQPISRGKIFLAVALVCALVLIIVFSYNKELFDHLTHKGEDEIVDFLFSSVKKLHPKNTDHRKWSPPTGGDPKIRAHNLFRISSAVAQVKKHVHKDYPPFVDWRLKNKYDVNSAEYDVLYSVRNQGECGCCWAFAISTIIADRYSIKTDGRVRVPLSIQQLSSCLSDGVLSNGCGGGDLIGGSQLVLKNKGLVPNSIYPYENGLRHDTIPCTYTQDDEIVKYGIEEGSIHNLTPGDAFSFQDEKLLELEQNKENVERMKNEIEQNGPIIVGMVVYCDLYAYDGSNVYIVSNSCTNPNTMDKSPNRIMGGHAVTIIGWSDKRKSDDEDPRHPTSTNEIPYWIVQNSWGPDWGQNGYFHIIMGRNECQIESYAVAANPDLKTLKRNSDGSYAIVSSSGLALIDDDGLFNKKNIIIYSVIGIAVILAVVLAYKYRSKLKFGKRK